ncbi:MAG: hypothetical protein ACLUOI_29275 [Eisenbergiella sp.]
MSNIEAPNAKTSVSLNLLMDIADALEIPVKYLFDFENENFSLLIFPALLFHCLYLHFLSEKLLCFFTFFPQSFRICPGFHSMLY